MTSAAVLSVTTAVAANATTSHASSSHEATGNAPRSDFRKPLLQARQQQQQASSSQQAPSGRDARPAATDSRTDHHAADPQDKAGKDDATATTATPDPATAMLALLGQSMPAQPTATPGSDAATQGDAVASPPAATLPAGMQAIANQQAAMPGLQPDADDLLDSKDVGATKGDATETTSAAADDSEETATSFADALAAMAKNTGADQASPSASNDHSHPLDALNSLMTSPLPQPAAAAAPAAHVLTMQSSVGTPAFAQELGQQVAWLGGQDVKEARIRLHPEDLGPLDVKVSVKQDHVDVSFIAQHPQAVHAVQQTLGQLDTLLAHHGLSLGHAEVGQGGRGQESGQGASSSGTNGAADDTPQEGGIAAVAAPVIKAIGLLDTFA
ncbi:flagellar hook-length control protein FliK [Dyella sp. EPa41]|uniref:flagellar hook-length control protein FliK n=1 Tax=Dyella sp. EPa41 TaxID=1561194 RepID=UPI00191536DB|nr:flagellar hook-length control protein FliK [Dyella sp. EPa41]